MTRAAKRAASAASSSSSPAAPTPAKDDGRAKFAKAFADRALSDESFVTVGVLKALVTDGLLVAGDGK